VEFALGREQITVLLSLKFSCFERIPYTFFVLAHFSAEKARQGALNIVKQLQHLQSTLSENEWEQVHPKILMYASYEDSLVQLAEGRVTPSELPGPLQTDIKRMAMALANETTMGGKHALAKCRLVRKSVKKGLPQSFSTELRFLEFQQRALGNAEKCVEVRMYMLEKFKAFHDPLVIVEHFGLQLHPYILRHYEETETVKKRKQK